MSTTFRVTFVCEYLPSETHFSCSQQLAEPPICQCESECGVIAKQTECNTCTKNTVLNVQSVVWCWGTRRTVFLADTFTLEANLAPISSHNGEECCYHHEYKTFKYHTHTTALFIIRINLPFIYLSGCLHAQNRAKHHRDGNATARNELS